VEPAGSDMRREVMRDRPVILLTATEVEAEPMRAALSDLEKYVVATKTVYTGTIGPKRPGCPEAGADPAGAPLSAALAAPAVRVVLAISGCDKANAAHILTCLLEAVTPPPLLVVQVGIAGALLGGGSEPAMAVGDIVLATQEAYSDTGSSSPDGWLSAAELGLPIACVDGNELAGRFPLDAGLVLAAAQAIEAIDWPGTRPVILRGPCVTASRATGLRSEAEATARRWSALAESMEGAAAAHMCALYKVPFLEIRGISNMVDDRDRGAWEVDRAVAVAGRVALAVVVALDRLPLGGNEGGASGRGNGGGGGVARSDGAQSNKDDGGR
jgi:futalosine hydrolase